MITLIGLCVIWYLFLCWCMYQDFEDRTAKTDGEAARRFVIAVAPFAYFMVGCVVIFNFIRARAGKGTTP